MIYITVVFVATNDLIFVQLNDVLGPTLLVVAKAWKETFIAGLLLFNLMRTDPSHPFSVTTITRRIIVVVLILSATGFGVGLMRSGLSDGIQQWRRYFVPILLAVLLASSGLPQRVNPRTLIRLLLSIACIMATYAIYEYVTFNGDFTQLWYYNFVAQAKESISTDAHLLQYQFMRGDQLRASGFFISAIEYSLFNALALTYAIISVYTARNFSTRIIFMLVSLLLIGGEIVANVRIGWVVFALALISVCQIHFVRIKSFSKLAVAPILILALSFLLIIVGKSDLDASSVGRLAQYAAVPSTFQIQGYGLGAITNNGATYKDSWYISVLMVFGVASIGYVWLMFLPLTTALPKIKLQSLTELRRNRAAYTLSLGTIGFFFAQLYVFGFHYSTGLSHLYLLQIFMFNVANNLTSPARVPTRSPRSDVRLQSYPSLNQ
ncbi:hypothetical protein VOI32_37645 [Paraburkholderia caribensis]|uniref:Polymerase n=2 Tax=Paraburkholderia caribensis TaxID=75105 RepID=A0ABV0E891_9BURK|nr:hypothetical protein [Paraburkholderia caribensis]